MTKKRLVIVGGGAAGFFCAVNAAEMNRQLETSDEPFGKVVKPLGFKRRTLSSQVLWQPACTPNPPRDLLRHTAVLVTATHVPFSVVVETYQRGLFDSP